MTLFETERLVVRLWTDGPADRDRLADLYSRPEVLRFLGATTTNDASVLAPRWRALHERDPRFGAWAVEVRETGIVAGTLLLKPLPGDGGEIETGWHFHPDSWGSGYATESARGGLRYGFDRGLDTIYAVVRADNDRSLAVVRRLGMRPLGRTDRYYDRELEMFAIERDETPGADRP